MVVVALPLGPGSPILPGVPSGPCPDIPSGPESPLGP